MTVAVLVEVLMVAEGTQAVEETPEEEEARADIKIKMNKMNINFDKRVLLYYDDN